MGSVTCNNAGWMVDYAGHLGLVDDDVVEVSNLQRQVVHSELDEGRCKVDSAKMSIQQ